MLYYFKVTQNLDIIHRSSEQMYHFCFFCVFFLSLTGSIKTKHNWASTVDVNSEFLWKMFIASTKYTQQSKTIEKSFL